MKYAVVSDIHANLSAFRAVLADARSRGAGAVVCLGDIAGYGPLPAEAAALARQSCAFAVAGNHDDAVSGRCGAGDFTGLAADAVARHRAALPQDARDWLSSLPYVCRFGEAAATHGDFTDPEAFLYVETPEDAAASFALTRERLLFVGHTHIPCIFVSDGGRASRLPL